MGGCLGLGHGWLQSRVASMITVICQHEGPTTGKCDADIWPRLPEISTDKYLHHPRYASQWGLKQAFFTMTGEA
jgi:hypothetical protein